MSLSKPYKKGRGLCLVINNVVFVKEMGDDESIHDGRVRGGAGLDASIISQAMAYLDMEFKFKENKTAAEINQLIEEAKNCVDSNQGKYHSLIIIISSHGSEGTICGADEQSVDVQKKIVEPFYNTECVGLQGRPKIFMINACR